MLKNIKKTNMTQQVIEQFKQQILDGSWRVGERIPSENELAQTLGVSRSCQTMGCLIYDLALDPMLKNRNLEKL